jgi:hypothetical protein
MKRSEEAEISQATLSFLLHLSTVWVIIMLESYKTYCTLQLLLQRIEAEVRCAVKYKQTNKQTNKQTLWPFSSQANYTDWRPSPVGEF